MSIKVILFTLCALPLLAVAEEKKAPEKPTLATVMAKYFAAQGGLDYIEGIDSIRMDGTIAQGDSTLDFVQIKKRPNLLRMTLEYGRTDVIMGYNGVVAWQTARGREQAIALEGEARTSFVRNAVMFSQLYQPNDPDVILDYAGEDMLEGKPVYKIEVTLSDGYKLLYFVDAEKYVDRMVVTIEEHDGKEQIMKTVFKDYRKLDKLQLPHLVESYIDGELRSTVMIDHIRLNPGIFTPYFDPPGGIEGSDAPATVREVADQAKAAEAGEIENTTATTPEATPGKATGRTITSTTGK